MSSLKESRIIGYPNEIAYESTVKIKEQMEKNIGQILIDNEQGTGFFCKILNEFLYQLDIIFFICISVRTGIAGFIADIDIRLNIEAVYVYAKV